MSSCNEPTTTLTGLRALQLTKELSRQTAETALASQPFAAERDGFAAAEGAERQAQVTKHSQRPTSEISTRATHRWRHYCYRSTARRLAANLPTICRQV
jgi:hypothetical protein